MATKRRYTLASLAAVLAAALPVTAANLYVKATGSGAACTQSSPCTLATALATMADDDSVVVAAGTYTGAGDEVVLLDRRVHLLGGWSGAPSGEPVRDPTAFETILDGQNARRVVKVTGDGATIEGLTITGGNASGTGAQCDNGATAGCGGGVFVDSAANVIVRGNVISGNIADTAGVPGWRESWGGGIMARHAGALVVSDNTIAGNTGSTASAGMGGGIFLQDCEGALVSRNRIVGNVGTTAAGVAASGGGIELRAAFGDCSGVVEENVLMGNRGATGTEASYGNALFTWYATGVTIRGNRIASDDPGSAVYLGYFTGWVLGNHVRAGADGRVVWLVNGNGADVVLANNVLIAGAGTARVVDVDGYSEYPLSAILLHNTVAGNRRSVGVHVDEDGAAMLRNNVVVSHAVAMETQPNGTLLADHTLLWWNGSEPILGTGPIHGDPLFVDRARGDLHILEGSAAIGAGLVVAGCVPGGLCGVGVDIDGERRPGLGGIDVGADELAPWRFDFGTPGSPVAPGNAQVTHATFGTERGFGWTSGTIGARDRGAGDDLRRDLCFTPSGTFAVTVPNGRYRVALTMGDAAAGHSQMAVFLENQKVATVSTAGNVFKELSFETAVSDGELTLGLDDEGGSDVNVVINALVIERALPARFDLGTPSSPLAAGYTRATHASPYSPASGFGWLGGIRQSRDRGTADPLRRDLVFTPRGLLGVYLENGAYDVTLTLGDAAAAHDDMGVSIQGAGPVAATAAKNQFVTRAFRACVADNRLEVLLDDLGGADKNVVVNAVEVARPPLLDFDFGTGASPVAPGYLQVTHATTYTPERGYGWISGTVASRDRATADPLTRDLNFTQDGRFVVDLAPGRYEVTVTLGDAASGHDQMGFSIEDPAPGGVPLDVVTTPAGVFFTKTYSVDVADGQLTLDLEDLGGNDPNAVINALEIR